MEQKTTMQLRKFTTHEIEKEKNAITAFRIHFASHCQTVMMNAGIPSSEWTVNHPTYLKFVHMALLSSFKKLKSLKSNLFLSLSAKEDEFLELLRSESSSNDDKKLTRALNNFNKGLIQYLQRKLLDAKYEDSEVEENHFLFQSFFSNVLIIEAEKFFRFQSGYESTLSISSANNKKRNIDQCSKEAGSNNFAYKKIKLHASYIELFKTTKRYDIYRISTADGMKVLKATISNNPTNEDLKNLENERKMGSQITHHAFRKPYETMMFQNKKALLLEWAVGNSLSEITKVSIETFFKIAREIVSCLIAMHSNEVCHLNLTCDHIILDTKTNSVKVIGCSSSSTFLSKPSYPNLLKRDLRCISPEQTAWVNREVDFRSDFYSLGVIFYRLLSGRYPFDSTAAMDIIKMHIYHEPVPLDKIDPSIPVTLSNMILKLMEKDADLRYQSAKGVMHDMDLIISEYNTGAELVLGQHDISSEILIVPQKMYGRCDECCQLLSAYHRMASLHSFELVFITGRSGSGKSKLAMELNKPVMINGVFLHGKYDLSKSRPFSALIETVKMLCDIILLDDEFAIAKYRSLIQDAVGEEGYLLTSIIDNLHSIIGSQPEIFENFGREATNRFNYVFIKLIKAIASIKPLVIVLEDLQWIDVASLDLITAMVESSIKNLMLVGVYRDDEIKKEHILAKLLDKVEKMNIITNHIKLSNLTHEQMNEFVSDTLQIPSLDSYSLSTFIYKKTLGNPFFTKQMLNTLLEQKQIQFSPEKSKWQWDSDIDNAKDVAESVLDLLQKKIKTLGKFAQQTLTIASLLGSPFSLSLIEILINNKKGIEEAIASGMIAHNNRRGTGCFEHDQIRHAASSLLPNDPKLVYQYVARKLRRRLSRVELSENICVVVNLFDKVKDMIDGKERIEVAELFLSAGDKAMSSTAPNEAYKYFKSAISLLDENSWKANYELTLKAYCNAAKSTYSIAHYKRMQEYMDEILNNTEVISDLVTPYLLIIRMKTDKHMYEDVIEYGLNFLNKLGVTIDQRPDLIQTKNLFGDPIEIMLQLKEMDDRRLISSMEIMNSILYSCFFSKNHRIVASVVSKMIELTLNHGISKYSSHAVCSFAVMLYNIGDRSSYEFGKLSLKLLEKSKAKEMIPIVQISFEALISPFFAPIHSSLDRLRKLACVSLEIGSHHYSASIIATYFTFSLFCGVPLSKSFDEICQFEEAFPMMTKSNKSMHQAMINLLDIEMKTPAKLSGEQFDCEFCFESNGCEREIARASATSCVIAYLFYDYQVASKFIEICKKHEHAFVNNFMKVIYHFYDGLVASEMSKNILNKERYIEIVEESIMNLKGYAKNAQMNYLNKVHLLEAELAVMCKKTSEAISHYHKAISLSKKHGFVNEEAMALERFAIFCLELGSQEDATFLLVQSHARYKDWGANSKMAHLIQKYKFLADALKSSSNTSDRFGEILKVDNDVDEVVSILTNLTSTSVSTVGGSKSNR